MRISATCPQGESIAGSRTATLKPDSFAEVPSFDQVALRL